ncbi:MAG: LysM peptidoglycan-binding domain-containing protein [Nitrospirae bacterium]|nr:LysM peptidoglycan-binding domain-containing protein [Nitrospirota bacterium]
MTTRLKHIMQSLCIVLIPILFSCTSHLQQKKADPAPPPAAVPQAEAPVPAPESAAVEPVPAAPESAPVAPEPAARETAVVQPEPAAEDLTLYIIKRGDTLWDISNTFLKDPFLWPFIWKANPAINNPDLIFTGNKLMIPGLAPIERALQAAAPEKPIVEKQEPARETAAPSEEPIRQREGIAGAYVSSPKPTQPVSAETGAEMPSGGNRLVMPEEQVYPVVDKYAMLSMGFVNEEETGDIITGSPEKGKAIFGYDDIVYVSMSGAENIKIGDKYLIFTPLNKVKHPKTGVYFGKLTKGLGILQITAKDPAADVLTARITLSFDAIEKGNMLTPYQEPVAIYHSSAKKAKDIKGYILEVTDKRSINAQYDVVYLDKGNADGVEPGDLFIVFEEPAKRGFPRKVIGEVQVLIVKEHTSTAVVRKSTEAMGKGNAVEFKK